MIYCLQTESQDRFVKIGFTDNLARRISQLRAGCPFRLQFIGDVFGSRTLESEIHHLLREFRTDGGNEWYHPAKEVQMVLESLGMEIFSISG